MSPTDPPHLALLCDAIARGRLALAEVAAIPPRELDALYELAAQCLDVGRDTEAVDLLAGLVTLFPFSARYWRAYAIALHRRPAFERARAAYDAALLLEPSHQLTRCYRAEVLLYLGRDDRARAELEAVRLGNEPVAAGRAGELLNQLERLRNWNPPPVGTEPELEAGSAANTPTFTLDGRRPLPLGHSEFAAPEPMREETPLTARVFLSPLPAELTAPKPMPREPSFTATAIIRRRQPVDRLPVITTDLEFSVTNTALLPARKAAVPARLDVVVAPTQPPKRSEEAPLEPTHTAVVLRRCGARLGEPTSDDGEPTERLDRRRR